VLVLIQDKFRGKFFMAKCRDKTHRATKWRGGKRAMHCVNNGKKIYWIRSANIGGFVFGLDVPYSDSVVAIMRKIRMGLGTRRFRWLPEKKLWGFHVVDIYYVHSRLTLGGMSRWQLDVSDECADNFADEYEKVFINHNSTHVRLSSWKPLESKDVDELLLKNKID
jgi:hypothetical protein